MAKKREITDIFDQDCRRTGRTLVRGEKAKEGEYLMAAAAVVWADGCYLVTKRSPQKTMAGMWEFPGGGSRKGEEPMDTLLRELEEETGIRASREQVTFLKRVYYEKYHLFMQVFLVEAQVKMEEVRLQEEEVCAAMFVTPQELKELYSSMTEIDKQIFTEAVNGLF